MMRGRLVDMIRVMQNIRTLLEGNTLSTLIYGEDSIILDELTPSDVPPYDGHELAGKSFLYGFICILWACMIRSRVIPRVSKTEMK